jgi:hypothetical protein
VREAVIPELGQHPGRVFTRYALRLDLLAWLAQFDNEHERMLCFDYAGDWDLFVDLVGDVPDGWLARHIGQALSANARKCTLASMAAGVTRCTMRVRTDTRCRADRARPIRKSQGFVDGSLALQRERSKFLGWLLTFLCVHRRKVRVSGMGFQGSIPQCKASPRRRV